jgi:membrane protein implicated in regulation of membrane protease activity
MTWETFYLTCFLLGLILSLLTFFSGLGHVHIGHFHIGSHPHIRIGAHKAGAGLSAVNGFTLTAFLCWFGGAGYLLQRYSPFAVSISMLMAVASGLFGALLLWAALFKLLLPRERVLEAADTEMAGVVAQVIGPIRAVDGIGEILFSQLGARRASPARSEDGRAIERGTEVIVMRYERGVAYVRPWDDLNSG